ncbi:hypothetical protein Purlil1_13714 [Purpureocillium lilacinum]|uniref:Uncharacterized protein n=1 Tax=Purpureocillium lilacinum TaxID=33203 RepID=A0ABR0BDY8_PURLI|nr:hypothetical protein Purlil1_13714 [Purpureocillium lilacinum]
MFSSTATIAEDTEIVDTMMYYRAQSKGGVLLAGAAEETYLADESHPPESQTSEDLSVHPRMGNRTLGWASVHLPSAVRQWAPACPEFGVSRLLTGADAQGNGSSTSLTIRTWTDAPSTDVGRLQPDNAAGDATQRCREPDAWLRQNADAMMQKNHINDLHLNN